MSLHTRQVWLIFCVLLFNIQGASHAFIMIIYGGLGVQMQHIEVLLIFLLPAWGLCSIAIFANSLYY